ncbi:glycosyltransferase family protein, partial [Staphylococcus epidermidis]
SLQYPQKQIIIINHPTSHNTPQIIYHFNKNHHFKFLHLQLNTAKPNPLNHAIKQPSYQYLISLHPHTLIHHHPPFYIIQHFKNNPKLPPLTPNPPIPNKTSILPKIHTIQYPTIIRSINPTQSLARAINTISALFT